MILVNSLRSCNPALVALFLLAVIALAVPTPAEAGSCERCTYELECEQGATCMIEERCSNESSRTMSNCWLDPHGHCWTSGGFCVWVRSIPSPLVLPTDGLSPQDLLVCEARDARRKAMVSAS